MLLSEEYQEFKRSANLFFLLLLADSQGVQQNLHTVLILLVLPAFPVPMEAIVAENINLSVALSLVLPLSWDQGGPR